MIFVDLRLRIPSYTVISPLKSSLMVTEAGAISVILPFGFEEGSVYSA